VESSCTPELQKVEEDTFAVLNGMFITLFLCEVSLFIMLCLIVLKYSSLHCVHCWCQRNCSNKKNKDMFIVHRKIQSCPFLFVRLLLFCSLLRKKWVKISFLKKDRFHSASERTFRWFSFGFSHVKSWVNKLYFVTFKVIVFSIILTLQS